jgi:hypothetical protein
MEWIKNLGVFSIGFCIVGLTFWLGGADFTERGHELGYQFYMCFSAGILSLIFYKIATILGLNNDTTN